jgi:hypothetical protein
MILKSTSEFTRPANTTAYAANQAVTNSTTVGAAMQFHNSSFLCDRVKLTRVLLRKSTNVVTNATFSLVLFSANPGVENDGVALAGLTFANRANYVGTVAIPTLAVLLNADHALQEVSTSLPISIGTGVATPASALKDLYGVLVATAAYTPGSAGIFSTVLYFEPMPARL